MFSNREKKPNLYEVMYIYIDKYICIHELEKDLMVNNTFEKGWRMK